MRESWIGIRRNPFLSLASVFTAGVAVFVLAVFLLGAMNLSNLIQFVERQVQVSVYLADNISVSERDALSRQLRGIEGVESVAFVTGEAALERLRQAFGENATLLEGIEEFNPLRDALEVQVSEAIAAARVVGAVKDHPRVADVSYGKELVSRLVAVTRALRVGVLGLAGLLGLATLFLIQNSVRLSVFARREEVTIMRLVGATPGIIRWPFVFEGMTLATGGAFVASVAVSVGYRWLVDFAGRNLAFLPVLPAGKVLYGLVPLLLLAAATIGAVGAVMALRRWLREQPVG
jgi:cell division transport system permease protein